MDSKTRGTTKIRITKDGESFSVETWGSCHPADCYHGVSKTEFHGNPLVIFRDSGFKITKLVLRVDGNLLHVQRFAHYLDNRQDKIDDYIFH
jgi:hypothetical protein